MSPEAHIIQEADLFCPGADQTPSRSHSSPTVPATVCHTLIVEGPNPLNVEQTRRDATAQEKRRTLARSLKSLGKSSVPLSEKTERERDPYIAAATFQV